MHSHRIFNFTDHDLVLYAEECDAQATPWVNLEFAYCHSRRDTYAKRITGVEAALFIAWSKGIKNADGNHRYVSGELPQQIVKQLPDWFWVAPAVGAGVHTGEAMTAA